MSGFDKRVTPGLCELAWNWDQIAADYRPGAFWFWNASMTESEIEGSVSQMAESGVREFVIHPIHGMETEYLSDEYFQRCRLALGTAADHGLRVWIYDEFGWPSGVAGGKLLREHPEHVGWYLKFEHNPDGSVHARPVQSPKVLDNVVGASWTRGERGYLDTLSPEAVKCFIDLTHEAYYRECGDFFGSTLVGFFSDEPVSMIHRDGPGPGWNTVGLPWSPSVPGLFEKRFGYEMEPLYADLATPGRSRAKDDYHKLVNELHADAYHGQIGRWCRDRAVKYTGHLGEDTPLQQVRYAGSPFACLKMMDEPGVDCLGFVTEPSERAVEHAVIASIAKHSGRQRVFCEAFGISGFDIRLSDMLRRVQVLGAHGVDHIAVMGFHQSLAGIRKRVYWPAFFVQAPWWDFYREFGNASARSLALTSLGRKRVPYAVLYPQTELEQVDPFLGNATEPKEPTNVLLDRLARAVFVAGGAFDFVFPEMLQQADVIDGRPAFGDAKYDCLLVLSEITYSDEEAALLDSIAARGARVVRGSIDDLCALLTSARPAWFPSVSIVHDGSSDDVRVYTYDYPDGVLLVVHNKSDDQRRVDLRSDEELCVWDVLSGRQSGVGRELAITLQPHATEYISTAFPGCAAVERIGGTRSISLEANWTIEGTMPNTARISGLEFSVNGKDWLAAVDPVPWTRDPDRKYSTGIPAELARSTAIHFRGTFDCNDVPADLGLVFEHGYLESVSVNGKRINLDFSMPARAWDDSCVKASIVEAAASGPNTVEGALRYPAYETSITSDAFFSYQPMPSCDVVLAGSFRLVGGSLSARPSAVTQLPADFVDLGWEQYCGTLRLTAQPDLDQQDAESIVGIEVLPLSDDCVEVCIDGASLGKMIAPPYRFAVDGLQAGKRCVEIAISGTSAGLMHRPVPFGLSSVKWSKRAAR